MNATSQRMLEMILMADETISPVQRDCVMAILNGHAPKRWPAFIERTLEKIVEQKTPTLCEVSHKTNLSRRESAEYMGISIRLFDQMKARGDIPFTRLTSRRLIFARKELDALIHERRIAIED